MENIINGLLFMVCICGMIYIITGAFKILKGGWNIIKEINEGIDASQRIKTLTKVPPHKAKKEEKIYVNGKHIETMTRINTPIEESIILGKKYNHSLEWHNEGFNSTNKKKG